MKTRESNRTYYPKLENTEQLLTHCVHCKAKRVEATLYARVSARQFGGNWNISGGFATFQNVQYRCRICGHVWGELESEKEGK